MKQWKFRRVISFLLALVLVLGAMPVGVFAQENPEAPKYEIYAYGSQGTVAADKEEAAEGETVTLTVTPDEGYEFGYFEALETENYDVVSVDFTDLGNNQYSFVMPAHGLDITAYCVEGAASVDEAGFVIKVNDVEMELVDGGTEACNSRYVSTLFRIINVTVPYGTTTVTVERTSDENSPNIQYMNGTSHSFGGNAMPNFEADVVNYDGLCISCGGKYYHVTFEFSKELPRTQIYKEDSVVGDGEMIVAYQGIVEDVLGDYDLPYHHVGLTSGTLAFQFTYDAADAQPLDMGGYYEFYMTPVLLDDPSYEQDMFYVTAEDNGDGTWNAVIDFMMLPQHITNYFSQNPGTGYAFVLCSGVEQIPVEMFSIEYGVTPGNRVVYQPFQNGFTFTGAEEVAYGADYTFTVEIKNGFMAGEDFAIIINDEIYATEPGTYTVENVTENLVIDVEGIEVVRAEEVTFYFSVEEGAKFVEQGGVIWALEEVTVPYFDLAQYDMEYLYYNPDCYKEGQASQAPGTKEQAEGVVTLLHALIWLTEVYYNELDPADAGKGWLYENGWPGFNVYSATAGSAFFYMWDFGTNFNYYINYEYPLGYPGWGATCDQIKLSDGDVVSMRYNDNSGNVGTYHHFGKKALVTKTVNVGQSFDLDLYRTGEDYANYTTPVYLVGEGHNVYLFAEDEIDVNPAGGTLMATTDANGKVTIDTTGLELGTYYLVSNSMSPAVMLLTVEGGDHIHQYDAVVTDPTCTEQGYTTYTCACGDSYVSDYTEPTGHNFVDGECANGCGTTATVIPESALFTDITCNAEGTITVSEEAPIVDYDLVFPYYHVTLPAGATTVYVTFPTADAIQNDGSYAWVRGIRIPEIEQTADYSPACVINDDGSVTVTLSVSSFYAEEAGNGVAACFWKDGTVNQMITFCNAAAEGGEEPEPIPGYKSEYGITVMVGDEEMDLVANGTETCGTMEATKLNVTVPAGTTEVTFVNITDEVLWSQMYVYSGAHDWTEYASNVTEATINLEECGTSFCVSDSANNWYHVNIIVEEPEPSYKSEYGITVMVGDEEMDLVANGSETCGTMEATKLNVTVPAGTTEVTFLNITDEVLWSQMYVYSGAHDWTEYASNVTEATINLEECGTSFCVSDSANNWYHVNIIVDEPPHEHSYDALVTEPTCTEGGYTTYTCASCGDTYTETVPATGHTEGETVVENEVAATCTENGSYDNVVHCSVCDEELSRETVTVDALGHDVILVESEPASCEMNGYEYYACSRCGGQEYTIILEATGHSYVDGECEHCGAEDPDAKPSKPCWSNWWDKWFGSWWGDDEEEETPTEPTVPSEPSEPTEPSEPEEEQKPSWPVWGGWFHWFWPFH